MKRMNALRSVLFGFLALVLSTNGLSQSKDVSMERAPLEQTKNELDIKPKHFWSNSKEIGLNVSPLLFKLVPFNIGDKSSGFIGIKTKYYGDVFAFRFTFGSDISNEQVNFFHLGLGYERRRVITSKFTYTSGWESLFEASSENPNQTANVILGATKFYGLEYNITETFFIGTESQFVLGASLGFNNSGPEIRFRAPIAIFANVRLHNKR